MGQGSEMSARWDDAWARIRNSTPVRKVIHATNRLWVRIAGIAVLSFLAIWVSRIVAPMTPEGLSETLGAQSVGSLLSILANSMLMVTTFSMTVVVSVFRSAAGQWTPRVHHLMMEDQTMQNTLAVLIGAYIYSMTSIVLLDTSMFPDDQVVVLFLFTILVLVLVVVSLVRWMIYLQTFGSLQDAAERIEEWTREALRERMARPCLGGHTLSDDVEIPDEATNWRADRSGYIRTIYQGSIQEAAEDTDARVYLLAPVGRFVAEGEVIAKVDGMTDDIEEALSQNVEIGDLRGFEQDPRFGLIVLSEIASKALSAGINDSGTAIEIIGRLRRILNGWRAEQSDEEVQHDRLWSPPLAASDALEDAFSAIVRDGAAVVEVQIALQKAFRQLCREGEAALRDAASDMAQDAYDRAIASLETEAERKRLAGKVAPTVVTG